MAETSGAMRQRPAARERRNLIQMVSSRSALDVLGVLGRRGCGLAQRADAGEIDAISIRRLIPRDGTDTLPLP